MTGKTNNKKGGTMEPMKEFTNVTFDEIQIGATQPKLPSP